VATLKKKKAKKKATKKLRTGRQKRNAAGLTGTQVEFLDALRVLHEVRKAAAATGVAFQTTYKWKKKETAYREAYEEAVAEAEESRKQDVRAKIHEIGYEGIESTIVEEERALRPVAGADGTITEQMITIRQKRRVEKKLSVSALLWEGNLLWGNPARVEVTGKDGGPIDARVSVEGFRKLAGL